MTDYISREAAIRANCYFCSEHLKDDSPCPEKCADYMKFVEIPAADVRPVWISVEDRLPELHDESFETDDEIIYYEISDPVLVVYNYDDQIVAMYEKDKDEDGNYIFEGWMANGDILHSVTHWMPLPHLPKEVSS